MHHQQTTFENIVGYGEIACNKQFLLFLQCFLLNQIIASPFVHIFDIISLFAVELEEPKIDISGQWSWLWVVAATALHFQLILCNVWKTVQGQKQAVFINILQKNKLCYTYHVLPIYFPLPQFLVEFYPVFLYDLSHTI